jgi:hypothetical protein
VPLSTFFSLRVRLWALASLRARLRALIFISFFYLGRSPITMRPLLKKTKQKKSGSSSKWLVSWFLHLKVVC